MQDCTDLTCQFKDKLHVHFYDERFDLVEDNKYTFIFDHKDNSCMRISKLSKEFIKYCSIYKDKYNATRQGKES
jgi:hypothetical protein